MMKSLLKGSWRESVIVILVFCFSGVLTIYIGRYLNDAHKPDERIRNDIAESLDVAPPNGATAFEESSNAINDDDVKLLFKFKASAAGYTSFVNQLTIINDDEQWQRQRAISDLSYYFSNSLPKNISDWVIGYRSCKKPYAVSTFYNPNTGWAIILLNPVD